MLVNSTQDIKEDTILFIAEGLSEVGFISKCLRSMNRDDPVICMKGIDNLRTLLKSVAGSPGFQSLRAIYVMVDADRSMSNRIDSLCDIFSNFSFIVEKGKVFSNEICCTLPCKLALYVSCGGSGSGTIENMIIEEINGHKSSECLDGLDACILQKSSISLSAKGKVQIFISMIDGGLCGTGRAFEKGIFDIRHVTYSRARSLIEKIVI